METNRVDYEKALNMTGISRYNLRNFFLCGCIIIGQVFEVYSMVFLAPASACELHTTSTQRQTMMFLPVAIMFMGGHGFGYLADAKGRKKVLVKCMLFGFIISVAAAFTSHWIVLCIFKYASAALMIAAYFLSQVLLSEFTPVAKRSVMVILSASIFFIAFGLMTVISIPILTFTFSFHIPFVNFTFNSWRLLSLIYSVPGALGALAASQTFESPKYLLSIGKEGKALEVLKSMYVMNTGKSDNNYEDKALLLNEDELKTTPKSTIKAVIARTMPIFKPPFRSFSMIAGVLGIFCSICFIVLTRYFVFIADVFVQSVGNGNANVSICEMIRRFQNSTNVEVVSGDCSINNSAMGVVFGVTMILAVLNMGLTGLVNFVDRKIPIIAIQLISGVVLVFINFSTHWVPTAMLFVVYLSGVINYGVIMSYIIDIYPTYIRSSATCMVMLVGFANADFIFGVGILNLIQNYCEIVFYVFGVITCLCAFLGYLLPSDEKIFELRKSNEEAET